MSCPPTHHCHCCCHWCWCHNCCRCCCLWGHHCCLCPRTHPWLQLCYCCCHQHQLQLGCCHYPPPPCLQAASFWPIIWTIGSRHQCHCATADGHIIRASCWPHDNLIVFLWFFISVHMHSRFCEGIIVPYMEIFGKKWTDLTSPTSPHRVF